MNKDNKKLAQQRRAAEREKQQRRDRARKYLPAILAAVAVIVIVVITAAYHAASKKSARAQQESLQAGSTAAPEASTDTGDAGTEASADSGKAVTGGLVLFDPAGVKGAYDISKDDLTYAQIKVKDYDTITMALDSTVAPKTVENFISLVKDGFYDGLTFHRIMDGFMIQGGDPLGNGTGGSDKNIKGEFSANGVDNPITHVRGAVSMARAQDMDSASSQFFIVQKDSTFLDGQYAGFGYVTDGMDVVDRICKDAKPTDGNGTIPKDQQPVIESIKIVK